MASHSKAKKIVTQSFYGFPWPRGSSRARARRFHKLDWPLLRHAAADSVHVPFYHKQPTKTDKASQVLSQGPLSGVPRSYRAIADHSRVWAFVSSVLAS
jgi:hypothetical protein